MISAKWLHGLTLLAGALAALVALSLILGPDSARDRHVSGPPTESLPREDESGIVPGTIGFQTHEDQSSVLPGTTAGPRPDEPQPTGEVSGREAPSSLERAGHDLAPVLRDGDPSHSGSPAQAADRSAAERSMSRARFEEALKVYNSGYYEEAALTFSAYIRREPTDVWGRYMAGLSQWKSGRIGEAEASLRAALTIEPDHIKSHINLVRVLLDLGRPKEALDPARRAVEIKPTSGQAHRVLGRVWHNLGIVEVAIESYRKALALDDHDAWAANNLGLIFLEEGRFGEALPLLTNAVEERGDVSIFRNNLGVALERTGNRAEAIEAYRAALRLDPSHANATANLLRLEGFAGKGSPSLLQTQGSDLHPAPKTVRPSAPAEGLVEEVKQSEPAWPGSVSVDEEKLVVAQIESVMVESVPAEKDTLESPPR